MQNSEALKFFKTEKQRQAIREMSMFNNYMLYGGSRSGKTFIAIYAMFVRAMKAKSRHCCLRLNFNHAKRSLWLDTIPKVVQTAFPELRTKQNKVDHYLEFPNGSQIWVGGLDDDKNVEKILGNEYSTLFFNECSQIPYSSVRVALTRLAEKNQLRKLALYDENPPSKRHWSYSLFKQYKDPDSWEDKDRSKYGSILMNPRDNENNIADNYISDILASLSKKDRERFEMGEFSDTESGQVYYAFKEDRHVKEFDRMDLPLWVGMDFNVNPAACVICQVTDSKVFVLDEICRQTTRGTKEIAEELERRYGKNLNIVPDATGKAIKSSAAGLSDHEILRQHGFKVHSSSNPFRVDRYAAVNSVCEEDNLIVHPRCVNLIKDIPAMFYLDGTNMPDVNSNKMLGHISDALGYLVFKTHGIIKFKNVAKVKQYA